MGFLDKILNLPGDVAGKTVEGVVRLPGVPLDVMEKTLEGAEKGFDKLGKSRETKEN